MFNILVYTWRCQKCQTAVDYVKVGINSLGELCLMWVCPNCAGEKENLCRVPLDKFVDDIPDPPAEVQTEQDKKFLKAMKIKVDDD